MKKVILGILAISSLSTLSHAQIELAPEAGLQLAQLSLGQNTGLDLKNKAGLKFGTALNIPVWKGLYVQPGLFYVSKGVRISEKETLWGITAQYKITMNFNYLEVPLNLGYRYKMGKAGSIFATAGPYVGIALSAKVKSKIEIGSPVNTTESETNKLQIGSDSSDDIKPLDFGLNFGVGYQAPFGAFVRLQYNLGLKNINNDPDDDNYIKNRGIGITVGYAIVLDK